MVETNSGTAQMGATINYEGNYNIKLQVSQVSKGSLDVRSAKMEGQILKATPQGWFVVAKGEGPIVTLNFRKD